MDELECAEAVEVTGEAREPVEMVCCGIGGHSRSVGSPFAGIAGCGRGTCGRITRECGAHEDGVAIVEGLVQRAEAGDGLDGDEVLEDASIGVRHMLFACGRGHGARPLRDLVVEFRVQLQFYSRGEHIGTQD